MTFINFADIPLVGHYCPTYELRNKPHPNPPLGKGREQKRLRLKHRKFPCPVSPPREPLFWPSGGLNLLLQFRHSRHPWRLWDFGGRLGRTPNRARAGHGRPVVATRKIPPEGGRKLLVHFRHFGPPGRQVFLRSKNQQAQVAFCRTGVQVSRAHGCAGATFWLLFFTKHIRAFCPSGRYAI